jgi:uncharacterized membrane protein YkvA (DUF1232 family)
MWARWLLWAKALKRQALILWYAARDPRTPLWIKLMLAVVIAYAFSPIDLIPDFIPVLGLLDEALLLPAIIWLMIRCLPESVMTAASAQAQAHTGRVTSRAGAIAIILIWLGTLALAGWFWFKPAS